MKKISLIKANCQTCKKELMTTSESLYGLNREKKEFGILCKSCVSREEKMRIHKVIGDRLNDNTNSR